jgi:hypothetical protein
MDSDGSDKEKYENQAKGIAKQVETGNYDLVVFTRDFHPEYHISLYPVKDAVNGVFPPHCRNSKRVCKDQYDNQQMKDNYKLVGTKDKGYKKVNEITGGNSSPIKYMNNLIKKSFGNNKSSIENNKSSIEIDYKNKDIIGTHLSYLFYNTSLAKNIYELNNDKTNIYTIGLKESKDENQIYNFEGKLNKNFNNWSEVSSLKYDNKTKIIALTKGEYCNFESYSAFNYHVQIDRKGFKEGKPVNTLKSLKAEGNNTTGLWEYILTQLGMNSEIPTINIDVCGLVTNICVINTVQQGIALWEKVYKTHDLNIYEKNKKIIKYKVNTVTFNLLDNLSIPLFVDAPLPDLEFKYETPIISNNTFKTKQLEDAIKLFKAKWHTDICIKDQSDLSGKFNLITGSEPHVINLIPPLQQGGFHSTNCNCQSCNNMYKSKYLKYKQKYLELKNIEINNLNEYIN